MKILIIEPSRPPKRAEIPHTLEAMQKVVGGYIEAIYPFSDPVALVCDEEGKLKNKQPNLLIMKQDLIVGTFFICGLSEEEFTDLSDELMEKYEKVFAMPRVIRRTGHGLEAID